MSIIKAALLICLLFLTGRTNAQTLFGFSAGNNINYYHTNVSDRSLTTLKPDIGFNGGVHVVQNLYGSFYLRVGLLYLSQHHSVERNGPIAGAYTKFKRDVVRVPVFSGLTLINKGKVKLSIIAGAYISYWISGAIKGKIHNILDFHTITECSDVIVNIELTSFKEDYQFNSQDKRFEYGLAIGTDVKYELNSRNKLFVSAQYHRETSLVNSTEITSMIKDGNQGVFFLFGILFSLGKEL